MAIDGPVSDTSRAIQHDPDQTWPTSVVLQVTWHIDGMNRIRTAVIDADAFFGHGGHGAPMPGESLINTIERMRREGPPPLPRKVGPARNAKSKAIPRTKRHAAGRAHANRQGAALRGKPKAPS
jgi:hypothetical protein